MHRHCGGVSPNEVLIVVKATGVVVNKDMSNRVVISERLPRITRTQRFRPQVSFQQTTLLLAVRLPLDALSTVKGWSHCDIIWLRLHPQRIKQVGKGNILEDEITKGHQRMHENREISLLLFRAQHPGQVEGTYY